VEDKATKQYVHSKCSTSDKIRLLGTPTADRSQRPTLQHASGSASLMRETPIKTEDGDLVPPPMKRVKEEDDSDRLKESVAALLAAAAVALAPVIAPAGSSPPPVASSDSVHLLNADTKTGLLPPPAAVP
jgi:hypothetical protein